MGAEPAQLKVEVISILPHDTKAFTQGLVVVGDVLYESTGQYGESSLRKIDLKTGKILEKYDLPKNYFGEGLAYVNGKLVQLTWREFVVFVYEMHPIRLVSKIPFEGEGWGLTADGPSLLMTNGSSNLLRRNAKTMAIEKKIAVKLNGKALTLLNDLICVKEDVYANVLGNNNLFRINKNTGEVTAVIDASDLLTAAERRKLSSESVLNGIAYRPKTDTFFITGKYWPRLFEVRFIPKTE